MNEYIEIFKDVVMNKYAQFSGRASRREFWGFVLVNILLSILVGIVGSILRIQNALSALYSLALLLPSLAVGVRRLHDTNRSGWWLLISLIPFLGAIVLIIFFIEESSAGNNQYGTPPVDRQTPPQKTM